MSLYEPCRSVLFAGGYRDHKQPKKQKKIADIS